MGNRENYKYLVWLFSGSSA